MAKKIEFQMKNRPIPLRKRGVAGAKPLQKKSVKMWGAFDSKGIVMEVNSSKEWLGRNYGDVRPVTVSWEEKKVQNK